MASLTEVEGARGFKLMHLNTRSLKSKYPRLLIELKDTTLDVMCFTETWLREELHSDSVKFNGYTLHRQDRTWVDPDLINELDENNEPKTGGGVGIYVKNCIQHDAYDLSHLNQSNQDIEIQCIRIEKPNNKKMVIINTYRPPNGHKPTFIEHLKQTLKAIPDIYKLEIVLTGDVNINLLGRNDNVTSLKKVFKDFSLYNLIKEPTRVKGPSKTLLDIICTNSKYISMSGVLNLNISDHYAIYMVKKKQVLLKPKVQVTGRSYKNYSIEDLKQILDLYDWGVYDNSNDPIIKWDIMHGTIEDYLNAKCPIKTFKVPADKKPWINDHLVNVLRDKNNLLAKARRTKLALDQDIADEAKKSANKLSRAARRKYIRDEIRATEKDNKKFWRNIQKVMPNGSMSDFIRLKDQDTGLIVPDIDVPAYINSFFVNIGPKLSKDMYSPWKSYDKREINSLKDFQTTEHEVLDISKQINVCKSSAIDNMSNMVIKDVFTYIPKKVADLFNSSFRSNIVPPKWKIATIVPIFKSGDAKNVSNYRPIALTPTPCKLIEKIAHKHMFNFINHHNILTGNQGGFRPGRSTIDTLASFTDDIARNLNVAKPTIAAFIDLSKAFDTVDHLILEDKLETYGIRGNCLKWLLSYLSDRTQKTKTNGLVSPLMRVVCGVPQGSILGPLLFLLYVNDLPKCVNKSCIKLYADDTVIYDSDTNVDIIQTRLQSSLDLFAMWSLQNKLTVNPSKTKLMIFTASKRKMNSMDVSLTLNDKKLSVVPSYKYLGVTLDPHLKYDIHIRTQLKKIAHRTYILSTIRQFLNVRITLRIFKSKIVPYFDYGDILYVATSQFLLDDLQYAQNRCLKISLVLPWLTDTDVVHSKAKIPKLEFRRLSHLYNFMYKRSQNVEYLEHAQRTTRANQAPILRRLIPHGNTYFRSVEHFGAMMFNMLPPPTRLLPSYKTFKSDRKTWLKSKIPLVLT